MSIHDEDWTVEHLVVVNQNGKGRFGSGSPVGVDFDEDQTALRLAAQAPAMARLLLELSKRGEGATSSWVDIEDVRAIQIVLRTAGVIE